MTLRARLAGLLVCLLAAASGGGLVYIWTLGLSAFTSYSYALVKAGSLPRAAPDISFVDQFGHEQQLASLRGRHILLHVFYGTCLTICPVVIEQLREIYTAIPDARRSKLVILSISVDPARDSTEHLFDLWRGEGAFKNWIMAQPVGSSFDRVWQEFGIWVFPKADGTINHSADLFLIDPTGQIVRVFPAELNDERIERYLEKYL